MKALMAIVAIAAICWVSVGCGGSGQPAFVPDKGSWAGTWNSTDLGRNGTMTLVVQADGSATGTMTDAVLFENDGVVQAQIENDGTFNGTVQFGTDSPMILTGKLVPNGAGHLAGTITEYITGNGYAVVANLAGH